MSVGELEKLTKAAFKDPLTTELFCDPVILVQTGISYERYVIEAHVSFNWNNFKRLKAAVPAESCPSFMHNRVTRIKAFLVEYTSTH